MGRKVAAFFLPYVTAESICHGDINLVSLLCGNDKFDEGRSIRDLIAGINGIFQNVAHYGAQINTVHLKVSWKQDLYICTDIIVCSPARIVVKQGIQSTVRAVVGGFLTGQSINIAV